MSLGRASSSAALWGCSLALVLALYVQSGLAQECVGSFRIMGDIGISPITVSQSRDGLLYLMDRRDLLNSKIRMPDGTFAHAVEYTVGRNTWRPIATVTNTWCSAGGYLADGTILNTAGNDAGLNAVRMLRPCSARYRRYFNGSGPGACNTWWEDSSKLQLAARRWYPTDQVLPGGQHIVVGGSIGGPSPRMIVPNYEIVDPYNAQKGRLFDLPFLQRAVPNYLYPFVHLLPSDLLFIFANVDGIILNYKTNTVVREVPKIPDGVSRSYPSTAASLLLPLDHANNYYRAEVLICGGNEVIASINTPATRSCWIIEVSKGNIDRKAFNWRGPYNMARGRCMPDLLYLMDGSILTINGVQSGIAGFYTAKDPNLWPEILRRNARGGIDVQSNLCPSTIIRGYHSEAILVPDGRVFVSGSNPNPRYVTNPRNLFNTEYRIEMFSPPYLNQNAIPRIVIEDWPRNVGYGVGFTVGVEFREMPPEAVSANNIRFGLISNAFVTHSLSMNLRYINIPFSVRGAGLAYAITATSPPSSIIAPAGPYMMAITYKDIPAWSFWVMVG